jgi:hypothetical protein
MLCVVTVYLCLAAIGSVCIDLFICFPVHYNWSLEYEEQGQSIWNSWPDFWINWTLNFSADVFRTFKHYYPCRQVHKTAAHMYSVFVAL